MSLPRSHTEEQKVRAYDALFHGSPPDIPDSQKAERWDRKAAKFRTKYQAGGDRGAYSFGSDSPRSMAAWCDCGKLRGSTNCTCVRDEVAA